jgi:glycosyltransferase involved in cell wall biosynthesis
MTMRIGLDAHLLGRGKGGVERVVHHMVQLLPDNLPDHEFVVLINRDFQPPFRARSNVRFRRLLVSDPLLQRSVLLPWLARRERLDCIHVQRAAPPFVRGRIVLHVHDLLPLTAPGDHPGFRDGIVRRLTPGSIRRADVVLTVSEAVATEIRTLFPDTAGKLTAVPNGVDTAFFRPRAEHAARGPVHVRLGLDGNYVLYLGALMPRKNLEVALRGFSAFLQNGRKPAGSRPFKLVLAGMSRSDAYASELRRIADRVAPGSICFAGFLPDQECLALLQHASIFLAPSRGEGFDLPALEAMACGIPVICSDLPVHRELLGPDVVYFSTDEPHSLAAALTSLESERRSRERVEAGLRRAATFTWEAAMQRLATVYRGIPAPFSYG